ncbi:phage tail tube protein [Kitasatospora sp. NPDC058170]|uniref:phage tail tube protein n=1 Tax=Kitasatospora sp. NPDC058170 TaxID=3346364 RepID=UPI0036DBD547
MALDASIGIGAEADYGVPATALVGYEGKSDSWKVSREFIESVGFRSGLQTARADRRTIVNMGGEGELELDVLDVGMADVLRSVFDKHTSTEANGKVTHVFETSTHSGAPSFTAQMVRPTVEGTRVAYKHVGCVAKEFTLTADLKGPVGIKVGFDFQDVSHSKVPAQILAPVYPAESRAYDWTRTAVSLRRSGAAVPLDANKLEIKADLGLKTDRRFLRGNALKRKPVRAAVPSFEGSAEGEFSDQTLPLYESFLAGEILGLAVDLVGITAGTSMKWEFPAVQFTGESPEASVDDVTAMKLPFRILDPGTGDAVIRVTYVEPSTAPTVPPAGG